MQISKENQNDTKEITFITENLQIVKARQFYKRFININNNLILFRFASSRKKKTKETIL